MMTVMKKNDYCNTASSFCPMDEKASPAIAEKRIRTGITTKKSKENKIDHDQIARSFAFQNFESDLFSIGG